MKKKRIFIADDHSLIRQGIAGIISESPEFEIAGEAETAEELINSAVLDDVDILTLDISFTDHSGLDLIKKITEKHPALKILILSMHNKPMLISRSINSGASGYILKSSPPARLQNALLQISENKKYLDPDLSESIFSLLKDDNTDSESPYNSLTPREQEIFRLFAEGKKSITISQELNISRKTVDNQHSRIMSKLQLSSSADLIRLADKLGVI